MIVYFNLQVRKKTIKYMQSVQDNDQNQQQFQLIVSQLKQWYFDNQIHFSKGQGALLLNIVRKFYNRSKLQINQLKKNCQEKMIKIDEYAQRLCQFEKENIDLKLMIDRYQQQRKQLIARNQISYILYQRGKKQLSIQYLNKQQLQRQKQQLINILTKKDQQILILNKSIFEYQNEIQQVQEKDSMLISHVESLRSQCQRYKISYDILNSSNKQLQQQIKVLKSLIDKAKQFNTYCNRIKSQNSIEQSSIEGDRGQNRQNLGFLKQMEILQVDRRGIQKKQSDDIQIYRRSPKQSEVSQSALSVQSIQHLGIYYFKNKQPNKYLPTPNPYKNIQDAERKKVEVIDRKRSLHHSPSSYPLISNIPIEDNLQILANKTGPIQNLNYVQKNSMSEAKQITINSPKKKICFNNPIQSQYKQQIQSDIQSKNNYYKKLLKQKQKQIIQLKMEKQSFKIILKDKQQQYATQIKYFKELYKEKMKQLLQAQKKKIQLKVKSNFQRIIRINRNILDQQNQLIKQRDLLQQQKKQFNNMIMQQSSSQFQLGYQPSKYNLSDDQGLQHQIVKQNEQQKLKIKILQGSQNQIDINFSKKFQNVSVQTMSIYCFKNVAQAKILGFVPYFAQSQQIQTITVGKSQEVGLQVDFTYIEAQIQTQYTDNWKFLKVKEYKNYQQILIQTDQITQETFQYAIQAAFYYNQQVQTDQIYKIEEDSDTQTYIVKLNLELRDVVVQSMFEKSQEIQTMEIPKLIKINTWNQTTFNNQRESQTQRLLKDKNTSVTLSTMIELDQAAQTDRNNFPSYQLLQQQKNQNKQIQTQSYDLTILKKEQFSQTQYIPQKQEFGIQTNLSYYKSYNNIKFFKQLDHQIMRFIHINGKPMAQGDIFESPQRLLSQHDNYDQAGDFGIFDGSIEKIQKSEIDEGDISRTNDKTEGNSISKDKQLNSFKKIKVNNSQNQSYLLKQKQNEIKIAKLEANNEHPFDDFSNISQIYRNDEKAISKNLKQQLDPIKPLNTSQSQPLIMLNELNQSIFQDFFSFGREQQFFDENNSQRFKNFQINQNYSINKNQSNNKKYQSTTQQMIMNTLNIDNKIIEKQNDYYDRNLPTIIQNKKIYIYQVYKQNDFEMKDKFIIWSEGVYLMKAKQFLKPKNKPMVCMDSQILILGNSQFVLRGNIIWVRRKLIHNYMQGNLQSGNWIVSSCTTYVIY